MVIEKPIVEKITEKVEATELNTNIIKQLIKRSNYNIFCSAFHITKLVNIKCI